MSKISLYNKQSMPPTVSNNGGVDFLHRALVHVTGALGLLISISFFTATYDSAQVKLTLLHMGGLLLLALWVALQVVRHKSPFTKQNLPFLLPVFAYLGWNVVCYIFAPYHLEAAEEFFRFLIYGLIMLLAATEFSFNDVKIITKWFLVAVWISFAYALLQIIDEVFPGADPMPWRGFFTKRIFSTHANPNFFADFVVFSSCIMASLFLLKRKISLLFLLLLGAVALFFTESKGAWLAYAFCLASGGVIYANYIGIPLHKYRRSINLLAAISILGAVTLVGVFASKRLQSVSFRAHTWLGTFEMIKDAPVMGVGTGNFKTIYSAYRRPQIFYIESAHNIETQHAENELLEQWAVSGTIGLAIFGWLVFFLLTLALRTLGQDSLDQEKKLYLFGYVMAFCAIGIHSLVDISLRFASTGFFFALFMGCLLALCRFKPLEQGEKVPDSSYPWLVWGLRIILYIGIVTLCVQLIRWFYEITSVLGKQTTGEVSLIILSWVTFLGCVLATAYLLIRVSWLLRNVWALVALLILLPLEWAAYAPFQANHYYSLGITFNQAGNIEGALIYFTKAIHFAPFQAEYRQFRANLLATTLDLTRRFSPARGDRKMPSNDYERALQDYAFVEKNSPNHSLLHHNKGQLYYTMALRRNEDIQQAHSSVEYELFRQEALHNMTLAKQSFERSLLADPVNPATYVYLIQIALLENNLGEAQRWIDTFRQGPAGVSEPEFLDRHQNFSPIAALQTQVNIRRRK